MSIAGNKCGCTISSWYRTALKLPGMCTMFFWRMRYLPTLWYCPRRRYCLLLRHNSGRNVHYGTRRHVFCNRFYLIWKQDSSLNQSRLQFCRFKDELCYPRLAVLGSQSDSKVRSFGAQLMVTCTISYDQCRYSANTRTFTGGCCCSDSPIPWVEWNSDPGL